MYSESLRTKNIDVNIERQINDIKRYIETGESRYSNSSTIIAVVRKAIEKAKAEGANMNEYEKEVGLLEADFKKRYVTEKICELENHKKNRNINKNSGIQLVRLINGKIDELEKEGIDVSEIRNRLYGVLNIK